VREEPLQAKITAASAVPATPKPRLEKEHPAEGADLEGLAQMITYIAESAPQAALEHLHSSAGGLPEVAKEEPEEEEGRSLKPSGTGERPQSAAEEVLPLSGDGDLDQAWPAQEHSQTCEAFTAAQMRPAPHSIQAQEAEMSEPVLECLEGSVDEDMIFAPWHDEMRLVEMAVGGAHAVESAHKAEEEGPVLQGLGPPRFAVAEVGRIAEVAGSSRPGAATGTALKSSDAREAAGRVEATKVTGMGGNAATVRSSVQNVLLHLHRTSSDIGVKHMPEVHMASKAAFLSVVQRGLCFAIGATCALFMAVELAWHFGPEPEPFV